MTDEQCIFVETRKISVEEAPKAYVWTWQTTLIAAQDVQIIKSVWEVPNYCSPPLGYCGLGLRLASDLFQRARFALLRRSAAQHRRGFLFGAREWR
jgi:hypothetical protein